jgi:hypothetical protein
LQVFDWGVCHLIQPLSVPKLPWHDVFYLTRFLSSAWAWPSNKFNFIELLFTSKLQLYSQTDKLLLWFYRLLWLSSKKFKGVSSVPREKDGVQYWRLIWLHCQFWGGDNDAWSKLISRLKRKVMNYTQTGVR